MGSVSSLIRGYTYLRIGVQVADAPHIPLHPESAR